MYIVVTFVHRFLNVKSYLLSETMPFFYDMICKVHVKYCKYVTLIPD